MSVFRRNRTGTTATQNARTRTISSPTGQISFLQGDRSTDGKDTISSTEYSRKCREFMELYRDLLALGAKTIFDLPRVVVIGGQSSGKSSLVEAVSGINVPRDSGTCTRCPMECNMSSNAQSWSCTIEIRYEYNSAGETQAHVLESFGPVIENKSHVELWIRRAQAAVLSPHRPRSDFLAMTESEIRENAKTDTSILPFSKNVVQVSVKDPAATDLSFVDLPGLIQNAEEDLINMVRSLVENYVSKTNTIVVIAMPMSDDIEMMQAVVIAGKSDPEKGRTIGVLTKPDTLTKGATGGREKWKAVLEGREHRTKHGYYCVRLPDDEERARKVSRLESQRIADTFFTSTPPWSEMSERRCFGIPNFVHDISALLVQLIEKNLPLMLKAVESELLKCVAELGELPPVLAKEPSTEIMLRISAFSKDIKDTVLGRKHYDFVQANRARYTSFKVDIEMTAPDFRPFEDISSTSPLLKTHTRARGLLDIRNVIRDSITWELPGNVPFEATKVLVQEYTSLWADPARACFKDIVNNTTRLLDTLLDKHFGQFSRLEEYIKSLVFEDRNGRQDDAYNMFERVLRLETNPIYTQNFQDLESEKKQWTTTFWQARRPHLQAPSVLSGTPTIPPSPIYPYSPAPPTKFTTDHSPLPIFTQDLRGDAQTWALEDEVKVMATVQAYFHVACKRFIDYVPLTIEHELN
ncbi:hypothetical protein M413DRAFT_448441 [Hebeloma cylindrosporum]|uniref:Dynamin-type G domain-containing protein n=1 Tax=Hebeloma cylindrosporum TaxID=76867 RepID=A0A0C3BZB0_HEBCY|nr:hypothetical protein M413DRAFT_448441 [Hebeloma cylindrosporum h7]